MELISFPRTLRSARASSRALPTPARVTVLQSLLTSRYRRPSLSWRNETGKQSRRESEGQRALLDMLRLVYDP